MSEHDMITPHVDHEARQAAYKANPALFAIALSSHAGFDAVARTMTPPPRYSRIEPPRLTLMIPEVIQGDQAPAASPCSQHSPEATAIQSTGSSPVADISPSRQEGRLLEKVKAEVRRRREGISRRLRKSNNSSRSSSAATSPQEISPPTRRLSSGISEGPANGAVELPTTSSHHSLPAISELDSRHITATVMQLASQVEPNNLHVQRTASVSSIVPTPRRGLSLVGPSPRGPTQSNVNPNELTGRLESLASQDLHHAAEVTVSPCSPISPHGELPLNHHLLARSNAITDRISSFPDPVSPLTPLPRSPSPPPTTPTLDGRLGFLPRLAVPHSSARGAPVNRNLSAPHAAQSIHQPRRQLAELDSGKETVMDNAPVSERLERPFTSSHWDAARTNNQALLPNIRVDSAANAPELVTSETQQFHGHELAGPSYTQHAQRPYTARPFKRTNSYSAFTGAVWEALLSGIMKSTEFLRERYGPEPPIPERHVRVRWTCTCGEDVYDDFIENRPGAAADLEAYLNRVPHQWSYSPSSSHPSGHNSPVFSAGGDPSPLSSATSWSSQGSNSPTMWDKNNLSRQPTRVASSNPYSLNLKSYIEPLWLYTCVNEGKWTTKMRHLDVNSSKINSDKDLALALGALQNQVNRKWYKLFKLRGLVNIKFVQFELHRNRYADVSRSPAVPDLQTMDGCSYEFTPHDLNPPVGSNYLMHLFKHPEDYDDELITYLRTPKRRDRLEIGTGWGLQLVEGFLAERVWGAIAGFFLVGSLVFAVVWACRKGDDVQGAFGVAGWMVAIAGLVMAWAQAVFD